MTNGPLIINKQTFDPLAVDVGERPALDLNQTHFDHRIKDLRVLGAWLPPEKGRREPCLVIVEANRGLPDTSPCIVPLDDLWKWSEEAGDELYVAEMAVEFCAHLANKDPRSTDDILQVIDTVRLRLYDLKCIPPAPEGPRRVAGHLIIRDSDERTVEKEVWEDV